MKKPDKIYCITLFDDFRLSRFKRQFDNSDFEIEYIRGVVEEKPRWYGCSHGFWGCQKAHRKVFQLFKESNYNNILVFEDDACLEDNFFENFSSLKVPDDWDMLYLGGRPVHKPQVVNDKISLCTNINLMHAYMINRKCLDDLIFFYDTKWGYGEQSGWKYMINDWKVGEFHKISNAYLCLPNLVSQFAGISGTEYKHYHERVY